MPRSEIACISHGEDADGLTCAAFIRRLMGSDTILVTYDDFEKALKQITGTLKELYICDINIREDLVDEVLRIREFAEVTIVDHHPWPPGLEEKLMDADVRVVHDLRECASVLLFNHFREELGREAGRLAAYAAWADQFEDGPIASRLLNEYDRQFVQHEALILAHAILNKQTPEFRSIVVEELSKLAYPHRIPGLVEASLDLLEEATHLIQEIPDKANKSGNFAFMTTPNEKPIGTIANLLLDALGVDVGLCYKMGDGEMASVSIRSRRGLSFHLGEITRRVASRHGGFGGGHKRASGASLPWSNLQDFIKDMGKEVLE